MESSYYWNKEMLRAPLKKLLLLGGSHAEIPLIQAAQSLGWYVITTGNNRDGLGHPYADKMVFADFSDKDAMLELARDNGIVIMRCDKRLYEACGLLYSNGLAGNKVR